MEFNEIQKSAIFDRGNSLLISASAGTGKTTILINRVTQLIIEGSTSIDKMLIMTFTDSAASELKLRLQSSLQRLVDDEETNCEVKKRLVSEIKKVQIADISTIHSFCSKVIQENYHAIGLQPSFTIMDANQEAKLKNQCLDDVFETAYQKIVTGSDESVDLANLSSAFYSYTSNFSDAELRKYVLMIFSNAMSNSEPTSFLKKIEEVAERRIKTLDEENFYIYLKQNVVKEINLAKKMLQDLERDFINFNVSDKLLSVISSDIVLAENLIYELSEKSYDKLTKLVEIKFATLRFSKEDKVKLLGDGFDYENYKQYRNMAKQTIKDAFASVYNCSEAEQIKRVHDSRDAVLGVIQLVAEFADLYKKRKLKENKLDYADLIHYSKQAISHAEVESYYKSKFDYIFVDEYQDTNKAQDIIVEMLRKIDNLYIVGDYKQSIYGFRKADPIIFLNREKDFKCSEQKHRALSLNLNYRTSPLIINYVNQIFDFLMTESFGGINYRETARLECGAPENFIDLFKPKMHIFSLNSSEDKEVSLVEKYNFYDEDWLKVGLLIKRIKELVGTVIATKDGEKVVSYSDIAILVRSKVRYARLLKRIFKEYGLNLDISMEENLLEITEVAILLKFLYLVENSADDIEILAVLRSQIGGFTDEELYRISQLTMESFAEKYRTYPELAEKDDPLAVKIIQFEQLVEDFRNDVYTTVSEKMTNLIDKTCYKYHILGLDSGEDILSAVQSFLEIVDDMESKQGKSLSRLVQDFKNMEENDEELTFVSQPKGDVESIKLVTIHASKGLEYPVVILYDVTKRFNEMDINSSFIVSDESVTSRAINRKFGTILETLERKSSSLHMKEKLKLEEARLLYVAMTRAKYILEMFAFTKETEFDKVKRANISYQPSEATTYFEWLYIYAELDKLPSLDSDAENYFLYESTTVDAIVYDVDNLVFADKGNEVVTAEEVLDVEIKNFQEKKIERNKKIQRKSVSELTKKDVKNFKVSKAKETKDSQKRFNKADIGNAYHKFFMYYMESDRSVRDIFDNDCNMYMSELEKEMIDVNKLLAFENHDFTKKIRLMPIKWAEKSFIYKKQSSDGEILVQGIIDFAYSDGEKLYIVDYKTDRVGEAELVKRYKHQLELYKEALETLTGYQVGKLYLYSVYNDEYYLCS